MPKHRLEVEDLHAADRIFAWLLILFGYVIAMAMSADSSGWDDPVFNVMRRLPATPYSWSGILAVAITVYAVGDISSPQRRWRGRVVVVGATMCFLWWAALALTMTRMVYELPNRITDMWPLVAFFIGLLYAARVVVYAGVFTGSRWSTNPYQLWDTLFVLVVSLSQMIIGVAPGTIFTEVERPVMFQLASVNFLGAAIVMFGLHLRNKETGLNLELAGAFSLVATLAWYCMSVLHTQTLAGTTLGFGLAEAFVFGTLHRGLQILVMKWAKRTGRPKLEKRIERALNAELRQEQR
jgi:hypothetical protein